MFYCCFIKVRLYFYRVWPNVSNNLFKHRFGFKIACCPNLYDQNIFPISRHNFSGEFFYLTAKAQLGYEYAQYDLGFGGAASRVAGSDVEKIIVKPTAYFNFNYNVSPFLNYVIEAQAGQLEGGATESRSKRYFKNDFTSVMFRAQLQAGEIFDYSQSRLNNALKNFYLSSGVGFVVNKLTVGESLRIPDGTGFYSPGRDHSNQLLIPMRLGYELKIFNKYNQPSFKIDLAYQLNYILGDDLDGFETGRNKNDVYDQLSIGIKFAIGGVTSYRKPISYR